MAFLVFVSASFSTVFWNYDKFVKSEIFSGLSQRDKLYVQDIKTKYYWKTPSLFLAEIVIYEDWSEDLKIGWYNESQVRWLSIDRSPDINSISSARFINLAGFKNPVVEVYGENHRGTGSLWIYVVNEEKSQANLLLKTMAIDRKNDGRWAPDNHEKYGYTHCGEIYRNGKLKSKYKDINNDNVADVVLSGTEEIVCEDLFENEKGERSYDEVKVAQSGIKKVFIWDVEGEKYIETSSNQ